MSTYVGLKCRDCNIESEHWYNRGHEYLKQHHAVIKCLEANSVNHDWLDIEPTR